MLQSRSHQPGVAKGLSTLGRSSDSSSSCTPVKTSHVISPATSHRLVLHPLPCLQPTWPAECVQVARPLLPVRATHALQRKRFCNQLTRTPHAAAGVKTQDDWTHFCCRADLLQAAAAGMIENRGMVSKNPKCRAAQWTNKLADVSMSRCQSRDQGPDLHVHTLYTLTLLNTHGINMSDETAQPHPPAAP